MLKISNFRVVIEDEAFVCDALVTRDGNFECFISRFSSDDYVEYSASPVPTYNQYFTNEEYVENESTELFVISEDSDIDESEGFSSSKYFVGYKLLDKVAFKYSLHQKVDEKDFIFDDEDIAQMNKNAIIKSLEFYETPGGFACGPVGGDVYAEIQIEDTRSGDNYYINVADAMGYIFAFINDYSGMVNVKSDPEHEKYETAEDMFDGYIEFIDADNTEVFDDVRVLTSKFGKAILLAVKLIYKDYNSDQDLEECAKVAIKPYIGKKLSEIDIPISWDEIEG